MGDQTKSSNRSILPVDQSLRNLLNRYPGKNSHVVLPRFNGTTCSPEATLDPVDISRSALARDLAILSTIVHGNYSLRIDNGNISRNGRYVDTIGNTLRVLETLHSNVAFDFSKSADLEIQIRSLFTDENLAANLISLISGKYRKWDEIPGDQTSVDKSRTAAYPGLSAATIRAVVSEALITNSGSSITVLSLGDAFDQIRTLRDVATLIASIKRYIFSLVRIWEVESATDAFRSSIGAVTPPLVVPLLELIHPAASLIDGMSLLYVSPPVAADLRVRLRDQVDTVRTNLSLVSVESAHRLVKYENGESIRQNLTIPGLPVIIKRNLLSMAADSSLNFSYLGQTYLASTGMSIIASGSIASNNVQLLYHVVGKMSFLIDVLMGTILMEAPEFKSVVAILDHFDDQHDTSTIDPIRDIFNISGRNLLRLKKLAAFIPPALKQHFQSTDVYEIVKKFKADNPYWELSGMVPALSREINYIFNFADFMESFGRQEFASLFDWNVAEEDLSTRAAIFRPRVVDWCAAIDRTMAITSLKDAGMSLASKVSFEMQKQVKVSRTLGANLVSSYVGINVPDDLKGTVKDLGVATTLPYISVPVPSYLKSTLQMTNDAFSNQALTSHAICDFDPKRSPVFEITGSVRSWYGATKDNIFVRTFYPHISMPNVLDLIERADYTNLFVLKDKKSVVDKRMTTIYEKVSAIWSSQVLTELSKTTLLRDLFIKTFSALPVGSSGSTYPLIVDVFDIHPDYENVSSDAPLYSSPLYEELKTSTVIVPTVFCPYCELNTEELEYSPIERQIHDYEIRKYEAFAQLLSEVGDSRQSTEGVWRVTSSVRSMNVLDLDESVSVAESETERTAFFDRSYAADTLVVLPRIWTSVNVLGGDIFNLDPTFNKSFFLWGYSGLLALESLPVEQIDIISNEMFK